MSSETSWNPHFHRNLRESEIDDLANLLVVIQAFQIVPSRSDIRLRSLSSSLSPLGILVLFAISSSPSYSPFPHRIIWFFLSPSKVQEFLWKIAWNRGPTLNIIQAIYPHIALSLNYRPLCLSASESIAQLFIHYPSVGRCEANFLSKQVRWVNKFLIPTCLNPQNRLISCHVEGRWQELLHLN